MPQDEESMWNKGIFGDKDSETLQHTMFYYNCKLFGLRCKTNTTNLSVVSLFLGLTTPGNM